MIVHGPEGSVLAAGSRLDMSMVCWQAGRFSGAADNTAHWTQGCWFLTLRDGFLSDKSFQALHYAVDSVVLRKDREEREERRVRGSFLSTWMSFPIGLSTLWEQGPCLACHCQVQYQAECLAHGSKCLQKREGLWGMEGAGKDRWIGGCLHRWNDQQASVERSHRKKDP